ncbi:hypothetical protein [Pseudomonas lini]
MNEYVDDGAKGRAWLDDENVQTTSYAHITELEDGSFREQGEGAQYSEVFWSDAVTTTLHQTHPRVPSLKTQLVCQYKFENGRIYVKTLRYHMTTRSGNWYRANIDIGLQAGEWKRLNSPDSMSQNNQWHDYVACLDSPLGAPDFGVSLSIRVDYDGTNNDVEPHEGWGLDIYPAQTPIIASPLSGAIVETPFHVSGRNGLVSGEVRGEIHLSYRLLNSIIRLTSTPVRNDGSWSASLTLPDSVDAFYAEQSMASEVSTPSSVVTIRHSVAKPEITSPKAGDILEVRRPTVSGVGIDGAEVRIYEANVGTIVFGEATVVGTSWSTVLAVDLPEGPFTFTAYQALNGMDSPWATDVPVIVKTTPSAPLITGPGANTVQDRVFAVSGTGGEAGAIVRVFLDLSETMVGESGTLTGGLWSAPVTGPIGPVLLVAKQIKGELESPRSTARAFKIRPPKLPQPDVDYPDYNTVRFSGTGYPRATVEIFIQNGAVQASIEIENDTWSVDWIGQPPGSYQMNARQSVSDGVGGWIPSELSGAFPVQIPVPVPSLNYQVDPDRIPEFYGTGHGWNNQPATRIEVRRVDESTPAVPIVEVKNGEWSSAATQAWVPGTYFVQAWQLFKPAGQTTELRSEPTGVISFDIKAPLPTVDITHDGLTPYFFGTCLDNARVTLWFDGDEGTLHQATVTGQAWDFTRPQPFMPGAHQVSVTQTIGGQTSNEISRPFNVALLKPVITYPLNIDVDHNPDIKGNGGVQGAVMTVFDYVTEKPLGEAIVVSNEWSVPLQNCPFGNQAVYAVQTYGEWLSERSATATFTVILFPPTIDHPQPDDLIPRLSRIDGYARPALGGREVATVELWLKDADAPLAKVRARARDGYWWYTAKLPLGEDALKVKQFFDGVESTFSPAHDFTVVPTKPVIESPALLQRIGSKVTISGFGYIADSIEVALRDAIETLLGTTVVREDRTWSLELHIDRSPGLHDLVVQQECEGYRSGWSEAHPIQLLSVPPTFTTPVAGQWSEDRPLFEGRGDNGKTIELVYWFDSQKPVTGGHTVVSDQWMATPDDPLSSGPQWVKARQVGDDGSDWGDSPRFEVMPSKEKPAAP